MAGGDQETWDWLFDRYRNESNAQEKAKLLRGLASIDSPWLLRQAYIYEGFILQADIMVIFVIFLDN